MALEFDETKLEKAAGFLKVLAHPVRIKIIYTLEDKEINVQDLVEAVGTTQPNVSQHLTIMRERNILSFRREANQIFYRVGDCRVLEFVNFAKTAFCEPPNEEP
jgi:DNA-binding transcriptional ArsR family regulator